MKTSRILYLGTDPSRYGQTVVHCPLIETKPLPLPQMIHENWNAFTHIILTSPNAARILSSHRSLEEKRILAIGRGTEETVGYDCFAVSSLETQEGMIELIKTIDLQESYMLYPRSSKARPLLAEYLKVTGIQHQICDLYETVYLKPEPIPALEDFEEIVFTSPSTVKAFLALYGFIPKNKKITCIGPITEQAIKDQEIDTISKIDQCEIL
ncbi:MAG: uroporphyrinogen-III synthase [Rhabdochlamydiaceae bacterium]